ncbi:hypothetical protein Pan44_45570 [Caulifigura coniformis]|uniref:Uncharacterized protein n=1 Tax=Caulifigura coniformis TaxID=2527983 RepID=A0A517SK56_9PLAN|nr:hypothetical protein [Caulifigura coniformis]QDT56502.1 hypothetical protein Pan44_45570 [Caulifigura coniformis]
MADLHDPVETGMPRSVRFGIAAVLILILFAVLIPRRAGNNNGDPGSGGAKGAGSDANAASARETERQLMAILTGLSPEYVAISSDRADRVAELGQWAGESLSKGDAATVTLDEEANAKWFSGEALADVNADSFGMRDGHHLTMANLAGGVVTRLVQQTTDPLEQIEELFQFVVRETVLMPDEFDRQLPATPFESLLVGRSTAAGRAWAFGILLRQLRIDAVLLEPKSKPAAWIIGVISPKGDVLLYDPRLGTAVPSGAGTEGFKTPATLKQVLEKPELLRELDVSTAAYPLSADDLKSVNVKLITDSSTSSERMAKLQTMVAGSLMEVFDGVGKNPLREQGLADRVIAAGANGGWTAADVSVWSHPEEQSEAFMSKGAEDGEEWKAITQVFAGPVVLTQVRKQTKGESDSLAEMDVKPTAEPLRLIRVIQLKGRTADALRGYGPIRTSADRLSMVTRDPALQEELAAALPLNRKAAEFAVYWIAVCQLDLNPKNVQQTLQAYIRTYPQGDMMSAVPDLWATALWKSGNVTGAVQLLEGGQRTPRREILLKQWKAVPGATPAAETSPAPAPAPKPAAEPGGEATPKPAPEETAGEKPSDEPSAAPAADDRPPAPPVAT